MKDNKNNKKGTDNKKSGNPKKNEAGRNKVKADNKLKSSEKNDKPSDTGKKDKVKSDAGIKKPVNKKVIIIAAVVLAVVIAVIIILAVRSATNKRIEKNRNVKLYEETDYPFSYKDTGVGIRFTLDGSKTPDLKWDVVVGDEDYVSADAEGEEVDGKVSYVVSPVNGGTTDIHFIRKTKVAELDVNVVDIGVNVYVDRLDEALDVIVLGDAEYVKGPDIVGEDTDSPVIINNASSDAYVDASEDAYYGDNDKNLFKGDIYFVNGQGDWMIESPDGRLYPVYYPYGEGDIAYIKRDTAASKDADVDSGDLPGKEERLGKSKVSEDATPQGMSVDDKPEPVEDDLAGADFILVNEKLGISKKFHVEFSDNGALITGIDSEE